MTVWGKRGYGEETCGRRGAWRRQWSDNMGRLVVTGTCNHRFVFQWFRGLSVVQGLFVLFIDPRLRWWLSRVCRLLYFTFYFLFFHTPTISLREYMVSEEAVTVNTYSLETLHSQPFYSIIVCMECLLLPVKCIPSVLFSRCLYMHDNVFVFIPPAVHSSHLTSHTLPHTHTHTHTHTHIVVSLSAPHLPPTQDSVNPPCIHIRLVILYFTFL